MDTGSIHDGEDLCLRVHLPIVVWKLILEDLDDPKDWLNFFYSFKTVPTELCLLFEKDRVGKLFPQIFKNYMEWDLERKEKEDQSGEEKTIADSDDEDNEEDDVKSVTENFNWLFDLRLVCKSWKMGVDKTLNDLSSVHILADVEPLCTSTIRVGLAGREWANLDSQLSYWMNDDFDPAIVNPFPYRAFSIDDMDCGDELSMDGNPPQSEFLVECRAKIGKFLEKFGHHVVEFSHTANSFRRYDNYEQWYITLRTWVSQMPNLERLRLSYWKMTPDHRKRFWMAGLKSAVARNPFPTLHKMKTFVALDVYIPVLNSLVKNNAQLENITVARQAVASLWNRFGSIPLKNLKSLTVCLTSMRESLEVENLGAPLEYLNLDFLPNIDVISIPLMCQSLEPFENTLTKLEIDLPSLSTGMAALTLPKLLELDIYIHERVEYCELDFGLAEAGAEKDGGFFLFLAPLCSLKRLGIGLFMDDPGQWFKCQQWENYLEEKLFLKLTKLLPTMDCLVINAGDKHFCLRALT